MYTIGGGTALPAVIAGEALAANAGSEIAATALPFTGIAFGVYVAFALAVCLTGVILQLLGRRGDTRS